MHVMISILALAWDLGVKGILDGASGRLNLLQGMHPAKCAVSYVGLGSIRIILLHQRVCNVMSETLSLRQRRV